MHKRSFNSEPVDLLVTGQDCGAGDLESSKHAG